MKNNPITKEEFKSAGKSFLIIGGFVLTLILGFVSPIVAAAVGFFTVCFLTQAILEK